MNFLSTQILRSRLVLTCLANSQIVGIQANALIERLPAQLNLLLRINLDDHAGKKRQQVLECPCIRLLIRLVCDMGYGAI